MICQEHIFSNTCFTPKRHSTKNQKWTFELTRRSSLSIGGSSPTRLTTQNAMPRLWGLRTNKRPACQRHCVNHRANRTFRKHSRVNEIKLSGRIASCQYCRRDNAQFKQENVIRKRNRKANKNQMDILCRKPLKRDKTEGPSHEIKAFSETNLGSYEANEATIERRLCEMNKILGFKSVCWALRCPWKESMRSIQWFSITQSEIHSSTSAKHLKDHKLVFIINSSNSRWSTIQHVNYNINNIHF